MSDGVRILWIGQPADSTAKCSKCNWSISAGAYHAHFEHQDLLGGNARGAFETFVADYAEVGSYSKRMLVVDRLVHAVHVSGDAVVRDLIEGRSRQVLAIWTGSLRASCEAFDPDLVRPVASTYVV